MLIRKLILKFLKPESIVWHDAAGNVIKTNAYIGTTRDYSSRNVFKDGHCVFSAATFKGRICRISKYTPETTETWNYDSNRELVWYGKGIFNPETKEVIEGKQYDYKTRKWETIKYERTKIGDDRLITVESYSNGNKITTDEVKDANGNTLVWRKTEFLAETNETRHSIIVGIFDDRGNEIVEGFYDDCYKNESAIIRRYDSENRFMGSWDINREGLDHSSIVKYSEDGLEKFEKIFSDVLGFYYKYEVTNKEKTRTYEYKIPKWLRWAFGF